MPTSGPSPCPGSVKYTPPRRSTTRSFGRLNGSPSNPAASVLACVAGCRIPTRIEPTRVCTAYRRPRRSSARPLAPFVSSRKLLTRSRASTATIRFARVSVNSSRPSGSPIGPSLPLKPSATRVTGVPAATTPSIPGATNDGIGAEGTLPCAATGAVTAGRSDGAWAAADHGSASASATSRSPVRRAATPSVRMRGGRIAPRRRA